MEALKKEMSEALRTLQHGNIAPVDLQQASIGPGMAIFSRYSKVMESDGSRMAVRTALSLIGQAVDQVLTEQETEYDAETAWAVAWFEDQGLAEGRYGKGETLSTAKNISVKGMEDAGVVTSGKGRVRLLKRSEMPADWDPASDRRFTIWEATQHLIRRLQSEGEDSAADLLRRLGPDNGDRARDLAYRLYTISERKGWTDEALAYNSLVVAWPELTKRAAADKATDVDQSQMF